MTQALIFIRVPVPRPVILPRLAGLGVAMPLRGSMVVELPRNQSTHGAFRLLSESKVQQPGLDSNTHRACIVC